MDNAPPNLTLATEADLPAIAALMNLAFRGSGSDAGWTTEAGVCTEKSNPRVVKVKSAQDGVRTDETGSLNRPRIRRIFV